MRSNAGWPVFAATAANELRSDPARLAALWAYLEGLVHAFTRAPRRIVHAFRDKIRALVEGFRQQPRLDDVSPGPGLRIMLVRHEPASHVLRLSDPAGSLRMLDRFPHPAPSRHILSCSSDRLDIAELLSLLELARPRFDDRAWLPWIKAPMFGPRGKRA